MLVKAASSQPGCLTPAPEPVPSSSHPSRRCWTEFLSLTGQPPPLPQPPAPCQWPKPVFGHLDTRSGPYLGSPLPRSSFKSTKRKPAPELRKAVLRKGRPGVGEGAHLKSGQGANPGRPPGLTFLRQPGLLTPSIPARATLGCYRESQHWVPGAWEGLLPGSYPEKSGRVVPASRGGALHHPAAPAPQGPSSSQRSGCEGRAKRRPGQGWEQEAGNCAPASGCSWVWKVGAGAGTSGSQGASADPNQEGCGVVSPEQPPSALRS